jgi:hypothetical protein
MLHKEAVNPELLQVAQTLTLLEQMDSFQLVGGTAIALQLGHRKSIDIDLFSNQKVDLRSLSRAIKNKFPEASDLNITEDNVSGIIKGVRVDIYHDWAIPFRKSTVIEEGIRMTALEDLAAFKLSAIIGRREKKDYIDLFFLFKHLKAQNVLQDFKAYEPLLSAKSLLFALTEVDTAKENKSPMPEMLVEFKWDDAVQTMNQAAKDYIKVLSEGKG